jgi:TetR/AcrR family transcriptional regulator, transcriptional repressor for nem operon
LTINRWSKAGAKSVFAVGQASAMLMSDPTQNLPDMDTREQILDATENLMQDRGYSGFSFQDVADIVGIRKASIYYYFPAKGDLGRAVVARYRTAMQSAFAGLPEARPSEFWPLLKQYLAPMVAYGKTPDKACLAGILIGELLNLPKELQTEIRAFFDEHEMFFTELLHRGREAGQFKFDGEARAMAQLLFSAMEGGLLIKRIKGEPAYFERLLAQATKLIS